MTQSTLQSKLITTACGQCYVGCGIKVQVENGVVVNIEGNPDTSQNRGKMCAKGKAGFMNLYNPNRVKTPLKRTNVRGSTANIYHDAVRLPRQKRRAPHGVRGSGSEGSHRILATVLHGHESAIVLADVERCGDSSGLYRFL